MNVNIFLSLLCTVFLMIAFANVSSIAVAQDTDGNIGSQQLNNDKSHYGAAISDNEIISLTDMYKAMTDKDSMNLKTQAIVQEVCQVKGCWMTLNTADNSLDEPIMVRFRDYGFFMPKDLGGAQVVLEGTAYRQVTSVDELKHYAQDAGKSKEEIEAITEPKEQIIFIADGVKVL